MKKNRNRSILPLTGLAFLTAAGMMALLLAAGHYAPFGQHSAAVMDANLQYLDFFAYLKDCMAGRNSLLYTYSSSLGQSNIALFAYYLASPVNLLLFLFPKTGIQSFFHTALAIKLGLAAACMAVYLQKRFEGKLRPLYVLLLSAGYAFMNYSFLQASNIMWLDGVYMLPLILLGVWSCLESGKMVLLTLSVGLSILFNWYSAGINCLFALLFVIPEAVLLVHDRKLTAGGLIRRLCLGAWSMALGVMISCVTFLPTLSLFFGGGAGDGDQQLFLDQYFDNLLTAVQGFTIGADSARGTLALYCGSAALLGCVCFFMSRRTDLYKKVTAAFFALFLFFCFYWRPLSSVFSLFKRADSYWYRYAYVGTFFVLFLAGAWFAREEEEDGEGRGRTLLRAGSSFAFVLLLTSYARRLQSLKMIYMTLVLALLLASLLALFVMAGRDGKRRLVTGALCLGLGLSELAYSGKILLFNHQNSQAGSYASYVREEEALLQALKEKDPSVYRISQLGARVRDGNGLMSEYNESMAYGFMGVASYSSTRDLKNIEFLDRLGYRNEENCLSIVNTSILPADSLLGVRYVLSDRALPGLSDTGLSGNGRTVYENPYALPMAFTAAGRAFPEEAEEVSDPFLYLNSLYSALAGEDLEIFVPAQAQVTREDPYHVSVLAEGLDQDAVLYGNIPWKAAIGGTLDVNGAYETGYACWLSPSVFSVPVSEDGTARLLLAADAEEEEDSLRNVDYETAAAVLSEEELKEADRSETGVYVPLERCVDALDYQFYTLDPEALEKAAADLSGKAAEDLEIQNGRVTCAAKGKEGDFLFLSIPCSEGIKVRVNGSLTEPRTFAGHLVMVPLAEGDNRVEITCGAPRLLSGALISLAGILLLGLSFVILYRRKNR